MAGELHIDGSSPDYVQQLIDHGNSYWEELDKVVVQPSSEPMTLVQKLRGVSRDVAVTLGLMAAPVGFIAAGLYFHQPPVALVGVGIGGLEGIGMYIYMTLDESFKIQRRP